MIANRVSPQTCVRKVRSPHCLEGGLTAGPLLLPGLPWILLVSCSWVVGFLRSLLAVEFGAGPFFPPGCPAMPAPEVWLLGDVWVCARAGNVTMASMAMAPVRRIILGSRASIAPVELQNRCSVPDHGSPAPYAGSVVLRKNPNGPLLTTRI